MHIAVPTNDGVSISGHFGRSAAFLVFGIENGQVVSREARPNAAACGDGSGDHGTHSHAGILDVLAGCDIVICGGMGQRVAEALQSGGIRAVVAGAAGPADEAVAAYLRGELSASPEGLCRCSH